MRAVGKAWTGETEPLQRLVRSLLYVLREKGSST